MGDYEEDFRWGMRYFGMWGENVFFKSVCKLTGLGVSRKF